MGIFRKIGGWLTEQSDHFIQGASAPQRRGYYGSQKAEDAYSGTGAQQPDAEGDDSAEPTVSVDPFGHGEGDYGGRVPYRSKYDREPEPAPQPAVQQPQAPFQPAVQQPTMVRPGQQNAWMQGTHQQVPVQPQPPQPPQPQAQQQQQAWPQGAQQPQPQPQQQPQKPQQPPQAWPQGAQQPQQAYPYGVQQPNNVVPFPGMQPAPDGSYYAHVEYVVSIHSRNECKNVIAFMKANASVFLNMEFIASDSERLRCVDLLSGAAYTLGCKLNKISLRGIYLISSPSVNVILDAATKRVSSTSETQGFVRQRYDGEGYAAYPGYEAQQRPEPARQPPVSGFSSGSPTTRFQAQGTQRNPPASFGDVMTGNPQATGAYAAASGQNTGFQRQSYPGQR